MMTKLSERLRALHDLAGTGYDVAWDLCCDHGFLGEALLDSSAARCVHFVDQVPDIMQRLTTRLAHNDRAHFFTVAAESLPPATNDKQLAVLAGVGGEKTIRILQALCQHRPFRSADWLLAPANDALDVRRWLARSGFGVVEQTLCIERGWCYDLFRVNRKAEASIPEFNPQWNPAIAEHQRQLEKWVRHLENRVTARHCDDASQTLAKLYRLSQRKCSEAS